MSWSITTSSIQKIIIILNISQLKYVEGGAQFKIWLFYMAHEPSFFIVMANHNWVLFFHQVIKNKKQRIHPWRGKKNLEHFSANGWSRNISDDIDKVVKILRWLAWFFSSRGKENKKKLKPMQAPGPILGAKMEH